MGLVVIKSLTIIVENAYKESLCDSSLTADSLTIAFSQCVDRLALLVFLATPDLVEFVNVRSLLCLGLLRTVPHVRTLI